MPFRKIRARVKKARGFSSESIKEAIIVHWDELQEMLNDKENAADLEQMKAHFNDWDENEELGDCLHSINAEELESAICSLNE